MHLDSSAVLSLEDAKFHVPFEVLVNAEFSTLGFLIHSLDRMLTFVEHSRFLRRLDSNGCVSAVITTPQLATSISGSTGVGICEDPKHTFFCLQNALVEAGFYGFRAPSQVHDSARIHPRAAIAETGVEIGPDVQIDANASIGSGSRLQRGVVVHAGAVVGAAGFQTLRRGPRYVEMSHAGGILIEEDAILFANSTIARGLFRQSTRVGARCRIGNNAFVSHNVTIGEDSLVGHGAIINGNVRLGRQCVIGPGAVLSNCISIGDGTQVSLGSVVIGDVDAGAHVSGNFAVPHGPFLRHVAQIR